MIRPTFRNSAVLGITLGALALTGVPVAVAAHAGETHASQTHDDATRHYTAKLSQLNDSGATGTAHLTLDGRTLTFNLEARGLEPNKVHPMHIHGKDHHEVAVCPAASRDVNDDGFVSVVEGAADYGPIKLNLTKPQTPFGAPPTTALFSPFAGTADTKNFPVADENGNQTFAMTYVFEDTTVAQNAYDSLMPLENQHIVLHGGDAPASVDADAFGLLGAPVAPADMDKVVYDALLPVACGEIDHKHNDNATPTPSPSTSPSPSPTPTATPSATNASAAAVTSFERTFNELKARFVRDQDAGVQNARDMFVRDFFEARNLFVDRLNQTGDIKTRDAVSHEYQMMLEQHVK